MPAKALFFSLALGVALIAPASSISADKAAASMGPTIYFVEIDSKSKQYSVHFETTPNKKYTVQASFVLPAVATNWVDVQVVPAYPFPNHWIYVEKYTNDVKRYFRLKVQ